MEKEIREREVEMLTDVPAISTHGVSSHGLEYFIHLCSILLYNSRKKVKGVFKEFCNGKKKKNDTLTCLYL